jgi:predicted branched-subunit amino acid permease
MEVTSTRPDQGISAARRAGIGVGVAVGCSGVAFGAAAVTAGLDVAQACVLSLFAFTGASQFALAGTVAGGGDLVAGTAGALLLGARNSLYGLRLAGPLGVRGLRRLATAHAVIDETTAVATAQLADARLDAVRDEPAPPAAAHADSGDDPSRHGAARADSAHLAPAAHTDVRTGPSPDGTARADHTASAHRTPADTSHADDRTGPSLDGAARSGRPAERARVHARTGDADDDAANRRARAGFYTTFVCLYLAWNATTLLGAVGTSRMADPAVLGLDAVGPACFLALLWPRLTANGAGRLRAVAVAGAAIALLATPVLPPGIPVLLAAIAALPAILRRPLLAGRRAAS